LRALNPTIQVLPFCEILDEDNAERIIGPADILVDCLDNYESRYILNDFSIQKGIPLVHGAIWGWMGQISFLKPPETACLQCLVPSPPAFGTFPAVGAAPGVIGSLQAMEVLKYLTGIGTNLKNTLLIIDGESMSFTPLSIKRDGSCPACSGLDRLP
jgi:adenylyltransferase/sulfurtransferase